MLPAAINLPYRIDGRDVYLVIQRFLRAEGKTSIYIHTRARRSHGAVKIDVPGGTRTKKR